MAPDDRSRARDQRNRTWIPDLIGGRYRVQREIGSGAAAVTVAALDQTLGRNVAVKLLKPESERDPEFAQRFSREARAAASVNNEHVVDVYDVGQDDDLLYLVMQLVDGSDLRHVIDGEGALPWRRAVEIARSVLAGLGAVHAAGIVHRDIKPQNVLIGNDGSVRVTDFGVAHVERDSAMTTVGMTVGTAAYMAPEQAQGNVPTPAADIYAVGVILYEMVTGKVPFSAPTSMAVMLAHIQQQAPAPVAPVGREALPDGLVAVIGQAMAKDPESRFRSAGAMQRALTQPDSFRSPAQPRTTSHATAATRAVPVAPSRRQPAPSGRAAKPGAERGETAGGGGVSTFLVSMLVVFAIGLVVAAGILWYLDRQQDDTTGAGVPQTQIVDVTPTLPADEQADEDTEPGVILPAGPSTEVPATDTQAPVDVIINPETDVDTTTDTDTEAPIPLAEPTAPSTEVDGGGIIEPIDDDPVIEPDQ